MKVDRRYILSVLAGAAVSAGEPVLAAEARIGRLIDEAKGLPSIAARIGFISRALVGSKYRDYTLIGSPKKPEQFVVRDDVFDCVTYCETVLAAAMAHDLAGFEAALRTVRYHNGVVAYNERNHYFHDWIQRNIANKTCRAVAIDGAVTIQKTLTWHREFGRRPVSMHVIPTAVFLANGKRVANGDIVGFVTHQPNLDYFHVGFAVHGGKGELMLRHASQMHQRVLDERMQAFIDAYRVRYVTLLRPEEPAAS